MSVRKKDHNYLLIAIALLSLNVVEQSAGVITATIPGMAKTFSNESLVSIEMITTIVSIFVTIFISLSGAVVKYIGQKNTAIMGLVIATIFSIIPAFSNNFSIIMFSRAMLGVGIGLANPLAISMIGLFFHGNQRLVLLGWRSAIAGIGSAIMTYLAGKLIIFDWHSAYFVYLLFIPTLILFVLFVPNTRNESKDVKDIGSTDYISENDTINKEKVSVLILILSLSILIFLVLANLMVVAVKIPTYFVENKIGTVSQASTAWSIVNFSTVIGGFIFSSLYNKMKRYVLPFGLFLGGLGIIMLSNLSSIMLIYFFCILSGIGMSLIIPYVFNRIIEVSSKKKLQLFTSIALVGSNLGSFLSPYFGILLGSSSQSIIRHSGIFVVILSICVILIILMMKKISTDNR